MAKLNFTIHSLFQGQSPTYYQGGSYLSSFGIDLDKKINGKTGGVISPTSITEKYALDGQVMWAVPNPLNKNTLVYTDTGWLYLLDENLELLSEDEASNPFPHRVSDPYEDDAHGNGLAFYNNHYYIFKDTNVDRYNPITGLYESDWWTSLTTKRTISTTAYGSSSDRGPYVDQFFMEQPSLTNDFFWSGNPNTTPPTNGTPVVSAQILNYGSGAGGTFSTTIKYVDLLVSFWGSNTDPAPVGEIRFSLQTTTGNALNREPTGTILAEQTIPFRTASWRNPLVDGKEVFPFGTEVPYTVEFEEPFVWVKGEHESIALVVELLNNTTLNQGVRVEGAELDEMWEVDRHWSGYVTQKVYKDGAYVWEKPNDNNLSSFALRFYEEKPVFLPLANPELPSVDGIMLPNHTAHVHSPDNNLYFVSENHVGRIQTRKTASVIYLNDIAAAVLKPTPGNTIVGLESGAQARVLNSVSNETDRNETVFTIEQGYTTGLQEIAIEVIAGEFIEHEELQTLSGITMGKIFNIQDGFYTGQFTNPSPLIISPDTHEMTGLASYGLDLAILTHQKKQDSFDTSMILWDAISSFYDREVPLKNTLGTAIFSGLGSVNVFYGDKEGYSLGTYVGGEKFQNLFYRDDSHSPLPGAVFTEYDRVLWGTKQTYPAPRLSVLSYGLKDSNLPKGVHNVFSSTVNTSVTALSRYPALGIFTDKLYTKGDYEVTSSLFRSGMYTINENFAVKSIRLSLEKAIDKDTEIEVYIYTDNEQKEWLVDTISAAKFDKKRVVTLKPQAEGYNNFFVEFRYKKGDNSILLPVDIKVETKPSA